MKSCIILLDCLPCVSSIIFSYSCGPTDTNRRPTSQATLCKPSRTTHQVSVLYRAPTRTAFNAGWRVGWLDVTMASRETIFPSRHLLQPTNVPDDVSVGS